MIQIATRMHRTVMHAITYKWVREARYLAPKTVDAVASVKAELTPENGRVDDDLWRLFTLDASYSWISERLNYKACPLASVRKYYPIYR